MRDTFVDFSDGDITKKDLIRYLRSYFVLFKSVTEYDAVMIHNTIKELKKMPVKEARRKARRFTNSL